MKCENCDKEMELEEYETMFLNNDEDVCLRERFWCPQCDKVVIKRTYYHKTHEYIGGN